MPGRLSLPVLAAATLVSLAGALVPADPTITSPAVLPRQNNDRFIGWVEFNGTWYSETCSPGLTWYQDGKYAQCCPATLASCYAPTACVSGSLIYPYSDKSTTVTIACTSNYDNASYSICNTAFIFENTGDSNPKTDIVCGESAVNWSYYRKIDPTLTEISSKAPTPIGQPVSTGLPNITQTSNAKGGGSKAWIAGAVVGPILGLALIGAVVWFLLRKKKKNKTAPQQGGAAMALVDPSQPPPGVGGYTDAKPQFPPQQQAYSDAPQPPAPQYNVGSVPYNAPGQEYYASDVKHNGVSAPQGGAAELGGGSSGTVPAAHNAHTHQAAELGGDSRQGGQGLFGPSELANTSTNTKPTT